MVINDGFIEYFGDATTHRSHVEQLDCAVHVMCAHHHVYIRRFFADHFFVLLRQATGNDNLALTAK